MENRQVLTIARLRAEAEDTYGQRLSDIVPSADKVSGGFSRDDGATVRKVSLSRCLPLLVLERGAGGIPTRCLPIAPVT